MNQEDFLTPYKKKIDCFMEELIEICEEAYTQGSFRLFVAGGAITSVFSKRDINDFDIYFYSREDFEAFHKQAKRFATTTTETERAVTMNIS